MLGFIILYHYVRFNTQLKEIIMERLYKTVCIRNFSFFSKIVCTERLCKYAAQRGVSAVQQMPIYMPPKILSAIRLQLY